MLPNLVSFRTYSRTGIKKINEYLLPSSRHVNEARGAEAGTIEAEARTLEAEARTDRMQMVSLLHELCDTDTHDMTLVSSNDFK